MKRVPATMGFFILCDDADYEALASCFWQARTDGKYGARRPGRSVRVGDKRRVEFVHHFLLGRPQKGMVIDHINGDAWDNRRENLRFCTVAENIRNSRGRDRGGIGKGISACNGRWEARVHFNKRQYKLGRYSSQRGAELAYDAAALYLHGEFARLNHPEVATLPCPPEILVAAAERIVRPARAKRILLGSSNGNKTRCDQGHAYTPENTYRRPNGHRDCRACIRARANAYRLRKAA